MPIVRRSRVDAAYVEYGDDAWGRRPEPTCGTAWGRRPGSLDAAMTPEDDVLSQLVAPLGNVALVRLALGTRSTDTHTQIVTLNRELTRSAQHRADKQTKRVSIAVPSLIYRKTRTPLAVLKIL